MKIPKVKIPKSELIKEFKTFAFKGNMIELAVGVVIGAAFGKVIDALVKSMLMPALSYLPLGERRLQGLEARQARGRRVHRRGHKLHPDRRRHLHRHREVARRLHEEAAPAARQAVPALHLGRPDRRDSLQVLHVRSREGVNPGPITVVLERACIWTPPRVPPRRSPSPSPSGSRRRDPISASRLRGSDTRAPTTTS